MSRKAWSENAQETYRLELEYNLARAREVLESLNGLHRCETDSYAQRHRDETGHWPAWGCCRVEV